MRWALGRAFVAAVLAVLLVAPAPALAAPTQLHAVPQQIQTYDWIEQQSEWTEFGQSACFVDPVPAGTVCNRTVAVGGGHCIWDLDDHTDVIFSGTYLKPGEEASWTRCDIQDTSHLYGMSQGDHHMTLTITIEGGGVSKSVSTTGSGLCLQGMAVMNDSPLRQTIPDSFGGTGVPGSVTFSVRNDTDRTERYGPGGSQTSAGSGIHGSSLYEDRWCPRGHWLHEQGEASFDPATGTSFAWDVGG